MLLTTLIAIMSAALFALAVAWLSKRHEPGELELTEGLKTTISTIAGFFMFASAFLAVNAWDNLSEARTVTYAEAGALREAYWAAGALPVHERRIFRTELREYTKSVIDMEWPKMNPNEVSGVSWEPLDKLRQTLIQTEIKRGGLQSPVLRDMDSRIHAIYDARRARLAEASHGLPGPMVILMLGLGALTLLLAAFTARPTTRMQWIFLGLGGSVFGCIMNLILELDYPLSGDVQIDPFAYREALKRFTEIGF